MEQKQKPERYGREKYDHLYVFEAINIALETISAQLDYLTDMIGNFPIYAPIPGKEPDHD